MEAQGRLKEVQDLFESILKQKGDVAKNYSQLVESILKGGTIPQKYKELMFVALSLTKKG